MYQSCSWVTESGAGPVGTRLETDPAPAAIRARP